MSDRSVIEFPPRQKQAPEQPKMEAQCCHVLTCLQFIGSLCAGETLSDLAYSKLQQAKLTLDMIVETQA